MKRINGVFSILFVLIIANQAGALSYEKIMAVIEHVAYDKEEHVMIDAFKDPYNSSTGFADYGKFAPETLNGANDLNSYPWDGMNTRHVIGINTVNFWECY